MKIGAFVVTHRRPEALSVSLQALLSQTRVPDLLLVVDNAADGATAEVVRGFAHPALVYEASDRNLGSAGGTERGVRALHEAGCDALYMGDDDNPPASGDTVERLVDLLLGGGDDVGGSGALGSRWDWRRGQLVRIPDDELQPRMEVDFVGGNHTLILSRRAVDDVGFPAGELFFGYPDLEYCLRLRRGGYRLLVDGELMHRLRERHGKLGKRSRRAALPHRPRTALWRHYYTSRNYVHMMRVTFARGDLARRETARALARCAASFARGPAYGADFTAYTLRGIADGWRGRQGPIVAPRAKVTQ